VLLAETVAPPDKQQISENLQHIHLFPLYKAGVKRLNRGQASGASLQKIWKSHSIPISTKIQLMKH